MSELNPYSCFVWRLEEQSPRRPLLLGNLLIPGIIVKRRLPNKQHTLIMTMINIVFNLSDRMTAPVVRGWTGAFELPIRREPNLRRINL